MREPTMGAIIGEVDRTMAILEVTASRLASGSTSRRIAWCRMRPGLGLGLGLGLGSRG